MPVESNPITPPAPRDAYDVFLSYNWRDVDAVSVIAKYLLGQGPVPFLDRWYLTAGQPWVPELERALAVCHAVAVFVGPHGLGQWQQREVHAALDRQGRTKGFPIIPVLLRGADPVLGFLGLSTWVDLRSDAERDFGLRLLVAGIRGQPLGPELEERLQATLAAVCPYRGLLYFREEDAPFFFGRDTVIGQLVKAVSHHRFLAVVGASGSGKSSVVRAGLVPALRCARDTVWEIATLVPGEHPFKALADALTPLLFPNLDAIDRSEKSNKLATRFAEGSVPLRDMVRDALAQQPGTHRLLLVADQWEELYTLTTDDGVCRRFMDELLDATEHSPLAVVLTLSGDFMGKALAYGPLGSRLQGAQINLGPMNQKELRQAIELPAAKVGLKFEPGLLDRILDDVGDEPGNLPLLEFVLRQIWERQRGGVLRNEEYNNIGRLRGAIAKHADKFFDALSESEQKLLRRIFLQIVRPSETGADTRRRVGVAELSDGASEVIGKLAKERLVVTSGATGRGDETVEVAHEAFIRHWDRLRGWLNEDREFLLWHDRFRGWLHEWHNAKGVEDALLRGPSLAEADNWLHVQRERLAKEEQEFISLSNQAHTKLLRNERDRLERDLARDRALAEEKAGRAEEAAQRKQAQMEAAIATVAAKKLMAERKSMPPEEVVGLLGRVGKPLADFFSPKRRKLERGFRSYVSPSVARYFLRHPERLKLGGTVKRVSIMFSDIQNFTKLSERMAPDDLVNLLNFYFEDAVPCIHATEGTVLNLIGDSIFAIWNDPESQKDHEVCAGHTALRLCRGGLRLSENSALPPFGTRIGLHAGNALVGNIGGANRFQYTAMGEAVNLASRIENLNRLLGTSIVVTHDFLKGVASQFVTRPVGLFHLKGLFPVVEIHELLGTADCAEASLPWRNTFVMGLSHFRRRLFAEAEDKFRQTLAIRPHDGPSQFYLDRMKDLSGWSLPIDWTGEVNV